MYLSICSLYHEAQNWAQVHPVSTKHPQDVSAACLESTWRSQWAQWPQSSVRGKSLKPKVFLELVNHPYWAMGREGPHSGRWPGTWWSLCQSFIIPLLREENLPEGWPSVLQSISLYGREGRKPLLTKRHMAAHLKFAKKAPDGLSDHKERNSLVWWDEDWTLWCDCPASCLEETRPTPSLKWSMVVAAPCCGDVFTSRNWATKSGWMERRMQHWIKHWTQGLFTKWFQAEVFFMVICLYLFLFFLQIMLRLICLDSIFVFLNLFNKITN